MTKKTHIAILGGGPAGIGAAYQVAQKNLASITVIEKEEDVGGIAGSFDICGINVDYGSHRLHPACDPEIMEDLKSLLGDDLMKRPRHGRIRLCNRWIHFPLKPFDLALKLPFSFSINTAMDLFRKTLGLKKHTYDTESFAGVLEFGLGRTVCHEFYFPYVHKIWGLYPEEISPAQAHRRVSANSLKKMLRKILCAVPGFKQPGSGFFFYPRKGFGQIVYAMASSSRQAGVEIRLQTTVRSIHLGQPHSIDLEKDGQVTSIQADYIWSTIPISELVQLINPPVPQSVVEASQNMLFRSMILVYLILEQSQFTEYDAHYFPDADIPLTRLSEPKNYSDSKEPENLTVLCAELPCFENDPEWKMTDLELGEIVSDSLKKVSIPLKTPPKMVVTRRISHAYPIYRKGYEMDFNPVDDWLGQIDNLISFGRQGLFAHDNTHHALYMAYAVADCLNENGEFDRDKWQNYYRKIFETHVVED
jgi:protoporphyrinogen oxidase